MKLNNNVGIIHYTVPYAFNNTTRLLASVGHLYIIYYNIMVRYIGTYAYNSCMRLDLIIIIYNIL